ncbi:MAG: potassium channel family protein [Planctomycetota bacterium]
MTTLPGTATSQHYATDSFLPLLLALIATLLVTPIAQPFPLVAGLIAAAAQLAGLYAVRHNKSMRFMAIIGVVICFPLRIVAQCIGDQYPLLIVASHVAGGMYFTILTVAVLVRVIAHQRVTSHTVIGAICGYLLIGYVFTFGYLVVIFVDPSAISINGQPLGVERVTNIGEHMAELFYFSFITLTTVGYGDIVPACPVTRTLALIEILTGQLYLAAFVARLVGAMSGPASNSNEM